jgi:hypothetical protein
LDASVVTSSPHASNEACSQNCFHGATMQRDIPRWDHPEDYKYTDTHTVRDWSWEFIRRNPEYIAEWNAAMRVFRDKKRYQAVLDDFLEGDPAELFFGRIERTLRKEGKKIKTLKEAAARYRKEFNLTNPDEFETFQLAVERNRWNLRCYQNPASKKLVGLNLSARGVYLRVHLKSERNNREFTMAPGECMAKLDLKLPLTPQLEMLEKLATDYQDALEKDLERMSKKSKQTIPPGGLWKTYIRCLDAIDLGVKRKQAANTLFTTTITKNGGQTAEQKWNETSRQAKAMRLSGYQALIL